MDKQVGYVDITLSTPVLMDGAQVAALRMREPTVGDQLALDGYKVGEAEKEVLMLSNLCQVAPNDMKQLSLRDYRKVQQAFVNFIN